MLNKYPFHKSGHLMNGGNRYTCTSMYKGCRSYLHVNKENVIVTTFIKHNHPPIKFIKLEDGRYVREDRFSDSLLTNGSLQHEISFNLGPAQFITTVRDTTLLMLNEYTYYKGGRNVKGGVRYTCSYLSKPRCKACVHVDKDNNITTAIGIHKHAPTKYVMMESGRYATQHDIDAEIKIESSGYLAKATFITGKRGSVKLLYDENTFFKTGKVLSNGSQRYLCTKYNSTSCRACVHLDTNNCIIYSRSKHNHAPPVDVRDNNMGLVVPIEN
ncbi:uncharacterized protein LOC114362973 [Ostrinia furnacalis]|uniref:uncharacterized protein LOC114362973 n=1 Tax=Ostrinia furnacalis TaxID=93504 RepID=UPI00103BE79D|nr:uncharacterized protein LOC114362973 [Ostrinia furnacalis]